MSTTTNNPLAGETDPGAAAGGAASGNTGGTPPSAANGAIDFSKPETFQSFVGSLPEDVRNEPTLKNFTSFEAVVKTMLSQQKMMGAEKILVPSKHATKEEWRDNVYKKLGLPDSVDKYEVKASDKADKGFVDAFKKIAHENNILPSQAQELLNWYEQTQNQSIEQYTKALNDKIGENVKSLQQELGKAFKEKADAAHRAVKELGGDDAVKFFKEHPELGSHPVLFKLFAKASELMSEHAVKDGRDPSLSGALAPDAARKQISQIMADRAHPYYVGDHPKHKEALEEMQRLMSMAYPEPTKD